MVKGLPNMTHAWNHRKFFFAASSLLLALAGCATQKAENLGPVFFPPAPNQPRIQYLMGISSSKEVTKEQQGLALFLTGNVEEEPNPIKKPYGVAEFNGKFYVCDSGSNTVVVIDPKNKYYGFLKGDQGFGKLKKPINLSLDKSGNIFVADTVRKEVLMYDPAGNFVRSYGKELDIKPVDVLADDEFVYLLDFRNSEIKVIDRASGELARTIGKASEGTPGLNLPTNFTLDSKGFIYVTNTGLGNIVKLDKDGHVLQTIGKMGDAFGEFSRPKGVAVDQEGRVYVVDAGHQNVQIFNENGRLLVFFGDPGLPLGSMTLPAGITTTKENLDYFQKLAAPGFVLENLIVVTNQFGRDKVAIYGLGQMKKDAEAGKTKAQDEKKKEDGK